MEGKTREETTAERNYPRQIPNRPVCMAEMVVLNKYFHVNY